ncbi:MAG: 23S rRNA (adenine(2503)-C(2))-methyltransferase RlmN [Acidimicrobiia bacterium]
MTPTDREPTRYGIDRAALGTMLTEWGEPRYRADQVWDALYRQRIPLDEATPLGKALRERLTTALPLALEPMTVQRDTRDRTRKWLWRCRADGVEIETVLMRYPTRATVCVSSQAGCAMACTFCATGQGGFERHLRAGEIIEQVASAAHASDQRVSNAVYMGMGEPLANYDAVWESVERIHTGFGLSARNITVSTVGVVPGIRRLAQEELPVTLAVSLHAPDDELRDQLVPLNRRYPIAEVLDAAQEFSEARGRRVTFEYALIAGVNDDTARAAALARLLKGFPGVGGAHVNLIPLNPTAGFPGHQPTPPAMGAFARSLESGGVTATVRRNRGTEIDAACGQLRSRGVISPAAAPSARMAP